MGTARVGSCHGPCQAFRKKIWAQYDMTYLLGGLYHAGLWALVGRGLVPEQPLAIYKDDPQNTKGEFSF